MLFACCWVSEACLSDFKCRVDAFTFSMVVVAFPMDFQGNCFLGIDMLQIQHCDRTCQGCLKPLKVCVVRDGGCELAVRILFDQVLAVECVWPTPCVAVLSCRRIARRC